MPNDNENKNEHASTEKAVDTAAKGAAEFVAPGIGSKVYNVAKKTPIIGKQMNKKNQKLARKLDKVPGIKKAAQGLDKSGVTDTANKGIDLVGKNPSKSNSTAKNSNTKTNSSSNSKNGSTNISNKDSMQTGKSKTSNNPNNKSNNQKHQEEIIKKKVTKKIITKVILLFSGCSLPFLGIFLILFIAFFVIFSAAGLFSGGNAGSNISSSGSGEECGFVITSSSLSKQEYKNKLEQYSQSYPNFKIFADNATAIFEYAKKKNVNPELVPVRAYVEGGGEITGGQYNYWGMGCTNTGGVAACHSYSTFREGYIAFIDNISQYDSLASMMQKYAYIGDFWYNPGSSSIGGCYYAPYIYENNIPSRVQAACGDNAPICTGGGGSCTVTTDEDQTAYANWQIKQKMAGAREEIFGLAFDEGVACRSYGGSSNGSISGGPNWSNTAAWRTENIYAKSSLYGQCTWFAWGRFYEIYGYSPGFTGNGVACAQQLVNAHPDKFIMSTEPKAGAVFSSPGPVAPYGHVGIVTAVNGDNVTIQEGNLDGVTNTWEAAQKDWQEVTYSKSVLRTVYPGIKFANPK